jgi:hypothetical protein
VLSQLDAQRGKLAAIRLPPSIPQDEKQAVQNAVAGSFVAGFRWVMWISALLAACSSLCAWLMLERRTAGTSSAPSR